MNSLLFYRSELVSEGKAVIHGERLEYITRWHDLSVGLRVRALLYGGSLGSAVITSLSSESLEAEVQFDESPVEKLPLHLLIAVPRPQTVKKVLETATSVGVQSIHFIRTENVIKSYLQSKTLQEEERTYHVIRGMEQACDPIPPTVTVSSLPFPKFLAEEFPERASEVGQIYVADTRASESSTLAAYPPKSGAPATLLCLGPESGWTLSEIQKLEERGARSISLGPRMLRVETALPLALGELRPYLI